MIVSLTDSQIQNIVSALRMAKNDGYPQSDPRNRKYQRIIEKLAHAVEEDTKRAIFKSPASIVKEVIQYTPSQKAKQKKGLKELANWANSLKPKK